MPGRRNELKSTRSIMSISRHQPSSTKEDLGSDVRQPEHKTSQNVASYTIPSISLLSIAFWKREHHSWAAFAASMGLIDGSSKPD